MLNLENI